MVNDNNLSWPRITSRVATATRLSTARSPCTARLLNSKPKLADQPSRFEGPPILPSRASVLN